MQSEKDAERMQKLGMPGDKCRVTGNMKFDNGSLPEISEGFTRSMFGFDEEDRVIVAGSTHFPEERCLIGIYSKLKVKYSDLKLILAPRHVLRADEIELQLQENGISCRRFSEIMRYPENKRGFDVMIVDTIGHLRNIYGIATVIFIGKSLIKKGGQNPIEAARWGKAVVFGPHMSNFRDISDRFLSENAAVKVKDPEELFSVLERLLQDSNERNKLGENAVKVIKKNAGAVERTVGMLKNILGKE